MKNLQLLTLFIFPAWLASCASVTEPLGMEDPFAIPRAFEDVPRNQSMLNPLLTVTSVVVEIPKGMKADLGPDLQSKIIRAFEDRDVAAQPSSTLPSWTVRGRHAGTFRADPKSVPTSVIIWRVYDKKNVKQGQFTSTYTGQTAADVVPRLSEQADLVSKQVLEFLSSAGDPGVASATADPQGADRIELSIGSISGATGDGSVSLSNALKTAMTAKGARVTEGPAAVGWRVECVVTISALSATEDRVQLVWKLLDPDKKEAGTLTQENPVPKGRLGKKWGDVASYAAEAAADGIWQILQQIRTGKDK
jgi:hypothetical protein